MFKSLVKNDDPVVLVITPLRELDRISNHTVDSIMCTSVHIHWISCSGNQNPYKNFDDALKWYQTTDTLPKYVIKMDNDIKADFDMIEKMVSTLDGSSDDVAYTYCDFGFEGTVNISFKAVPFNAKRLTMANYISSISMMKSEALEVIGGVETSDRYFRLLDWVLWLKFLKCGYKGVPTPDTSFVAYAGLNSVSSGSHYDYVEKYKRVYNDFILPMHPNKQDQNLFQ